MQIIETLKGRLQKQISTFKSNANHRKAPAGIGYLRARLETSIKFYNRYRI